MPVAVCMHIRVKAAMLSLSSAIMAPNDQQTRGKCFSCVLTNALLGHVLGVYAIYGNRIELHEEPAALVTGCRLGDTAMSP